MWYQSVVIMIAEPSIAAGRRRGRIHRNTPIRSWIDPARILPNDSPVARILRSVKIKMALSDPLSFP